MERTEDHRRRRKLTLLILTPLSLLILLKTSCFLRADDFIPIDLTSRTIDRISVDKAPADFTAKLGNQNVEPFTFESEGEKGRGFHLKFKSGEVIDLYQPFVSITTKGFRTAEGLGIGSTWGEFQKAYWKDELAWLPSANAIWCDKLKFRLYFDGEGPPRPTARVIGIDISRAGVDYENFAYDSRP